MSSQRLPGKVLLPLCGVPMLLVMYDRVKRAKNIDSIVIATSMDRTDNPIREMCCEHGIKSYSGSLTDVLDRFYRLSQLFSPDHIVRLTGDCPLINHEVIDSTIKTHIDGGYDYTRATTACGWPDGYDTEVFTVEALCRAWKEAKREHDREHVTPYFYDNPGLFRIGEYRNGVDQSGVKLSVDTAEDFQRVERILYYAKRLQQV